MGRKSNPTARPYRLSAEALAQRKQAAVERWQALEGEARSLPGRPKKKRGPRRDAATGRFLAVSK